MIYVRVMTPFMMLVLVLASLPMVACGESDLQKVKQASNDIVIGIDAGIEFARDAELSRLVSPEAAAAIRAVLVDVRAVARVANDKLQTYTEFNKANRADLLKLFGDVVGGLRELAELGNLHIKNETALRRFRIVMTALDTARRIIESRLNRG